VKRSFLYTVMVLATLTGCGTIDKGKLFSTLMDVAGSVIRYAAEHPEAFIAHNVSVDASTVNDASSDTE
jgi:hypothetical protein